MLITQWPGYISSQPDASVEMHCYQNNTDHPYMSWYRQQRGKEPVLMATLVAGSPSYEPGFDSGFGVSSSEKKMWSLAVEAVRSTDEAVYLCAASQHGAAESRSSETISLPGRLPGGSDTCCSWPSLLTGGGKEWVFLSRQLPYLPPEGEKS